MTVASLPKRWSWRVPIADIKTGLPTREHYQLIATTQHWTTQTAVLDAGLSAQLSDVRYRLEDARSETGQVRAELAAFKGDPRLESGPKAEALALAALQRFATGNDKDISREARSLAAQAMIQVLARPEVQTSQRLAELSNQITGLQRQLTVVQQAQGGGKSSSETAGAQQSINGGFDFLLGGQQSAMLALRLDSITTEDVTEGSSSLFFTDARSRAALSASSPLTYNSVSGLFATNANLTAFGALTVAADKLPYGTGSNTWAMADLTAFARTILDDADASAVRTTLGLVIGTNVQAQDAELAAIAGLTSAADRLPYFTGLGTAALATFTAGGRALVNSAGTADTFPYFSASNTVTLGTITAGGRALVNSAGTINTFPYFSASNVVTLGSITAAGRALLDDADAAAQRTTLGLTIGTNVQAYDAELAAIAGLTSAASKVPYFTGSGTAALADFQLTTTAATPTLSGSGGGTPTSASATVNYVRIGNIVFFDFLITAITVASATGTFQFTLPVTPATANTFVFDEYASIGRKIIASNSAASSILVLYRWDETTTTLVAGYGFRGSGCYRV